ncbi:MAG: TonB-dependent receptor [Bacteroidales bacterium]|nr:TonB-dependent receptor [Bacteroidales bacterium]
MKLKNLYRVVLTASLCLCALLMSQNASAQKKTISGTVFDNDNFPLIGAAVMIGSDASTGVITDLDGNFTIQAKPSDVLTITYIGFATQTVTVGDQTKLTIVLSPDQNILDDVVVIGYGSVKKSDLTGSVVNVKMGDIKDTPALSIDNALQGRIAGADFMSTDGAPGSTSTIRIRGTRSITASNEPLIVVDGVMDAINDLNDINSDDIASISVLKDASSTAIYGSRGANGVIIITTKQGSGTSGKPNITFKADVGISHLPAKLDIMNAAEFAMYRNDYAYFGGDPNHQGVGSSSPLSESVYSNPMNLVGTDWIAEITRPAVTQNYALSLSGKTDKSSYYSSFSYNDTEGIIQGSGQQRFTGRLAFDRDLFDWLKVGYSGTYTYRHQDMAKASIGGTSYWNSAQYLSPLIKPGDSENPLYGGGQRINTPRMLIDMNTYYKEFHSTNHTFKVDINPFENFNIKSQFSYFLFQRHTYRYYPGTLPAKGENQGGEALREEYDNYSLSNETTIGYTFDQLDDHSLNLLAGFSAYKSGNNNFTLSGSGYMDDAVKWNNMNAVIDKETYSASSSYSSKTKMSFFGRVDYNYKSRYYITATGRFDGASNFASNHKWAFFPSCALRWNVANEEFLKDVDWIGDLSLRGSAGLTGNDAISEFRSLAALSSTTSGYLFDSSQPVAYYRSRLASPNLTWEKTALYNAAVDISFFDGRFNVTGEYYYSKTTDLLLTLQVATQTGYSSRYGNIGVTSNSGFELSLDSQNIVHKDFSWSTTFTISHNKQLVEDIGSEDFVAAYSSPGNNPYMMYGYVSGYPLNSLWGFKYAGVWHNQNEIDINSVTKSYASASGARLGYAKYIDHNHDGTLNQDDLVYQGSADPWLYGGLQNTFYIFGLKVGVYFAYSLGGKIYNFSELYMAGSTMTNQYRYMLNSWHPVRNPESNLPRAGSSDVSLPSDFMIYDASYLRFKTLSLSYTFDLQKRIKWLRDITLTLVGDNLYLWKNYNGFDPDVSSEGSSSTLRRADIGAYPKSRTVTFSVQIRY